MPLGELGLRGGAAHGVQGELEHENAKVAGLGELLLRPTGHRGHQLLGRLDGVQCFDLLELGGQALVQQGKEQLILGGEGGYARHGKGTGRHPLAQGGARMPARSG